VDPPRIEASRPSLFMSVSAAMADSLLPEPSAGRLAARSLDVLFKYASGPRGSACPSRNATAQFRDEPS
jgi:hypothetical protein